MRRRNENALLAGNDDWNVQHAIEPEFTVRASECGPDAGDFNVNLWATARIFKADFCARSTTCASGAVAARRTLYLGPWNRDEEADPFEPFATLHEYGHLLGLGDTYRIPGANDWRGRDQPESVMSGDSEELTDDDKLGLWVVVRAIKTGVRSCSGFGGRVRMTHNAWDSLICDPRARGVRNHR